MSGKSQIPTAKSTKSRSRSRSPSRIAKSKKKTTTVTEVNSRSESPARRGRPRMSSPGRKTASGKSTRSTKDAVVLTSPEESTTTTRLRPRKKIDYAFSDQQSPDIYSNGTKKIHVLVDEVTSEARGSPRQAATPRPKINTSIFENISLTPTQRMIVEEKEPRADTPRMKITDQTVHASGIVEKYRQRFLKLWPIWLGLLLLVLAVSTCAYVYVYHKETVADICTSIKEGMNHEWFQDEI